MKRILEIIELCEKSNCCRNLEFDLTLEQFREIVKQEKLTTDFTQHYVYANWEKKDFTIIFWVKTILGKEIIEQIKRN